MIDTGREPDLELLLLTVREVFEGAGEWPTHQYVQAVLHQDHDLELDDILETASRTLVYTSGTQEASEVVLTVAGLAGGGATDDIERFIEALRWCVAEQSGFRPSQPGTSEELKLTAGQFKSEWESRGRKVSAVDLKKLRAMITTEGIYSSLGGEDGNWTVTLTHRIVRAYRDVDSLADYLRVRSGNDSVPEPALPLMEAPFLQAVGDIQAAQPEAVFFDDLPAKVRNACAILFQQGHFSAGVLDATKVMRDLLRDASGLSADGDELVGRALGGTNPRIIVADLSAETGKSRQRGVMLVAQGVFAAIRNPLAHERIVLTPAEARHMVSMIAFVVAAIESRRSA